MKFKKGFTLIELLVVIAIIGILATISVLALSNARVKSRDAKRAGDIKQIQTALELFFNDKQRYPTTEEWNTGKIYSTTTGSTSTYMQIIPNAPTPADGLCTDTKNTISYTPSSDWGSYSISFCLGNTTGTLTPGPKCLTPGGIIDMDCSIGSCGGVSQVVVSSINGYVCNESAPYYDKCTYDTVEIGTQCWMKQNMNVGTMVAGANNQTNNSTIEKYCYGYRQDGNAGQQSTGVASCNTYGGLYQWNEAMQYSTSEGAQGICPVGWHIPTDTQQNILDQYLTDPPNTCIAGRSTWGCANAGTKLKSGGASNFDGLLAGYRYFDFWFYFNGAYAFFWSSSINGSNAWTRVLFSGDSTVSRGFDTQAVGLSVRCLKD